MLIALSTIGINKYDVCDYCWRTEGQEGQVYRTALFPLAVDAFFHPDKLLLIVTEEARLHENYERIERRLGERLQPVQVPLGKTEDELWQIFDIVSDAVPEGSRIIFDMTHAFRSLPFVIFGVINYLRLTKRVTLERIVYGAFDARDTRTGEIALVPVFDLTMMVELQEWLHAVEDFNLRCEGERLANLLEDAQRRPWSSGQGSRDELPHQLKKMGGCIRDFSRSVRLLRPLEALNAASRAIGLARSIEQEAVRWAKPFRHILSRIVEELTPLSIAEVDSLDEQGLRSQLSLINHFLEKGLVVQAVLMEREWLVSWLAWRAGFERWRDREVRREMEEAMGLAAQRLYRGGGEKVPDPDWYVNLPEADNVTRLWSELTTLRNDIAHCAMNDSPASPQSIIERARDIAQKLEQLMISSK